MFSLKLLFKRFTSFARINLFKLGVSHRQILDIGPNTHVLHFDGPHYLLTSLARSVWKNIRPRCARSLLSITWSDIFPYRPRVRLVIS